MVMDMQRDLAAFADGLTGIYDKVAADVRKQLLDASANRHKFLEPILGFYHAVDWTEPWLIGVLVFHVIMLFLAVVTRRNMSIQAPLFLASVIFVLYAERLNTVLARHWERFATQPYFDRHGTFLSTLWSGPLLLVSSLILINSLRTLVQLIVQWKRAELRHRARSARAKAD